MSNRHEDMGRLTNIHDTEVGVISAGLTEVDLNANPITDGSHCIMNGTTWKDGVVEDLNLESLSNGSHHITNGTTEKDDTPKDLTADPLSNGSHPITKGIAGEDIIVDAYEAGVDDDHDDPPLGENGSGAAALTAGTVSKKRKKKKPKSQRGIVHITSTSIPHNSAKDV